MRTESMPRGGKRTGAGRKSAWNSGKTIAIRIPEVFAPQLIQIARAMDKGQDIEWEAKPQPVDVSPEQSSLSPVEEAKPRQIEMESISVPAASGKAPPAKADGKRWLTTRQAYVIAQSMGCERTFTGFRKWCARHPEKCETEFYLLRLQSPRGNRAPSFKNLKCPEP